MTAPAPAAYATGTDFATFQYSGSDNVDLTGFDQMIDATASSVETYALSTEAVNGVVPVKHHPKGPEHKGNGLFRAS